MRQGVKLGKLGPAVGLAPSLANQVARYAQTVDTSMSKAIAALVCIGLESQGSQPGFL